MELTAKIVGGPTAVVDVVLKEGKEVIRKNLKLKDYIKLLLDSVEEEAEFKKLGKMPHGYLEGGLSQTPGTMWVTLQLPGEERTLLYYGEAMTVPFPSLVFHFVTHQGKVTTSLCFAAKEELTKDANLYHYPFGNVYGDGRICWGNISLPQIEEMADFDRLVSLFLSGSTNDDLWKQLTAEPTQRAFINSLKGKKDFPVEILKKAGKASQIL